MKTALFLLMLFFSASSFASQCEVTSDTTGSQCFLEGSVNLRLSGTLLQGSIGTEFVNFSVFGGVATGYIQNEYVRLNVSEDSFSGSVRIEGWIRSSYVTWTGTGGVITDYQPCIY